MKCQHNSNCHHDAVPGTDRCESHTNKRERVRRYKLVNKKLQDRIGELTSVDYMASLEEEVALAQTMLEERLNAAKSDPLEIIAAHEATNRSLETISKLVQVMHKHDIATGEVLSKPALLRLMAGVIEDIAAELEPFAEHPGYADVMDNIANKIEQRIERANNNED